MKLNPYVRFALHHTYIEGYYIEREIWDHEIIYIEEGSMKITIQDKVYIASKGDVIILRPSVPHKIEWNGEDCKQPHVHFDFVEREDSKNVGVSLRLPKYMTGNDKMHFRQDFLKRNGIDIPYVFSLKEPKIIKTIIYKIISEFEYGFIEYDLMLKGLLIELFASILRDYRLGQIDNHTDDSKKIEKLTEYMVENVENSLTLEELVEFTDINKWDLNHTFKKIYSTTPIRYYNLLRVAKSKNLIMYSGLSIKQVGYKMGFDTPQTFSRWFKNLDGKSPVEYK
jgi:AraC-like DNA-binding protein